MTAPNSAERKACWDARDSFWKCLDDNNDKAESCQKFQSEFEAKCPAQWVKYLILLHVSLSLWIGVIGQWTVVKSLGKLQHFDINNLNDYSIDL